MFVMFPTGCACVQEICCTPSLDHIQSITSPLRLTPFLAFVFVLLPMTVLCVALRISFSRLAMMESYQRGLQAAVNAAERADKAKADFISLLCHEVNNFFVLRFVSIPCDL